jgi:hypothetical protein
VKTIVDGVRPWRHDLAGCLHACAATLLAHRGLDPVDVLGAAWLFHYDAGDFRREEYYFPLQPGESLFGALAPYHRVGSRWHAPPDAQQSWAQVRELVGNGTPVAVAVDNFHLPFRPAFRDVHANHLIIVYGFDDEAGTVRVLDAVPPRFDGDIALDELRVARGSANEGAHDRDMFFADRQIGHRWLELTTDEPPAEPDAARIADILRRNHDSFVHKGSGGPRYEGRAGLEAFLADLENRLAAGEPVADELFVVAGAALSVTGLHATWLAAAGRRLGAGSLAELGREVERVAHHWTAVRIMAALTRNGDVSVARLARRHRELRAAYDRAFASIDDWAEELC